jgi:hypothetical protein
VDVANGDARAQGANFSGKSVYLKQIALLTFMAHIGAHPFPDRSSCRADNSAVWRRLLRPGGRGAHWLGGPNHDEGFDEGVDHEGELRSSAISLALEADTK